VTLNGATSVTANFVPRRSAILVSLDLRDGATGRVTSNPAGIDCPGDCTELFPEGYSVTLTEVPGPGSTFAGWNGSNVRDPSILLIVGQPFPGDRIVTATFER
jgi:hypothetical protein